MTTIKYTFDKLFIGYKDK